MRVISWNMGMAGWSRHKPGIHDQAWHYLLGLGPDLALLQEALPPAWVRGEGALIHGPIKRWGSVIFSPRFPLERFVLPAESNLRNLGTYLALSEVSMPDGRNAFGASIHAVARDATPAHLGGRDPRDFARPSATRPRVNDVVFAGVDELLQGRERFIVAGDWNTGRGQGSAHGRKVGQEFFDRAHARGWFDCVWETLGHEVQTWFREGDRLLQDDHVFCDRSLGNELRRVRVAAEAASELRLSDHAPLILDFEVAPIGMTGLKWGS